LMEARSFKIRDRAMLMRVASMLSKMLVSEERPLLVEISDWKAPKTEAQRNTFHSFLRDVAENLLVDGRKFSLEAWKEHFVSKYLGEVEIVLPTGEIRKRRMSTEEANVEQYSKLIDGTLNELAEDYGYLAEIAA